jgi:hypothetical protein
MTPRRFFILIIIFVAAFLSILALTQDWLSIILKQFLNQILSIGLKIKSDCIDDE